MAEQFPGYKWRAEREGGIQLAEEGAEFARLQRLADEYAREFNP